MNNTVTSIGDLQARLNALVTTTNLYTEDLAELYTVSTELDQLIVAYYREYNH